MLITRSPSSASWDPMHVSWVEVIGQLKHLEHQINCAVYFYLKLYLLCFSRDEVPSENLMVVSDTVDIVRRRPANTGDQLSVTGLT